jgi:hypothetical protein
MLFTRVRLFRRSFAVRLASRIGEPAVEEHEPLMPVRLPAERPDRGRVQGDNRPTTSC